jgi:hypothetical protein
MCKYADQSGQLEVILYPNFMLHNLPWSLVTTWQAHKLVGSDINTLNIKLCVVIGMQKNMQLWFR